MLWRPFKYPTTWASSWYEAGIQAVSIYQIPYSWGEGTGGKGRGERDRQRERERERETERDKDRERETDDKN